MWSFENACIPQKILLHPINSAQTSSMIIKVSMKSGPSWLWVLLGNESWLLLFFFYLESSLFSSSDWLSSGTTTRRPSWSGWMRRTTPESSLWRREATWRECLRDSAEDSHRYSHMRTNTIFTEPITRIAMLICQSVHRFDPDWNINNNYGTNCRETWNIVQTISSPSRWIVIILVIPWLFM